MDESIIWSNKKVNIEIPRGGFVKVGNGHWSQKGLIEIVEEGITEISVKKNEEDIAPSRQKVYIDSTAPIAELLASPILNQEGGIYYGTPETEFIIKAIDALSGIKSIEVSIDGEKYQKYDFPLKLLIGRHELRCRVIDHAGNMNEFMSGQTLSGGRTNVVVIEINNQ